MTTEHPLSDNHRRFCAEYVVTFPRNATDAYQRVYADSSRTAAGVNAARLMADPRIAAEIDRLQADSKRELKLEAVDVLREIFLVASADPRELTEHHVGACRHCHGDAHLYQRTPNELRRDYVAWCALEADNERRAHKEGRAFIPKPFDMQGGEGFNPYKEPHHGCPECFGKGVGFEVCKDTRYLSAAAAKLYQGVEKTREGLKIKIRSQDKAIELAGQTLGLFKTKTELTGPGGGPLQSISTVTADPIEAARIYQQMMQGAP